MAAERQSSTHPPAHPSYILRGHASQIHSVQFVRQNTRLITGDADGWVIYWRLETKRALAMRASDESTLSTALPAEATSGDRPMPWLLHTLPVNTLNFCAFSMCYAPVQIVAPDSQDTKGKAQVTSHKSNASIFVAVPARDDKKAEVYQFPEERLKYVVPRAQSEDTGMVMAVKLVRDPTTNRTLVITGYEGRLTAVHLLPKDDGSAIGVAQLVYLSQPHTQPILSLDVSPDAKTYFTSGADAVVAAHRIPDLPTREEDKKTPPHIQADGDDPPVSIPTQHPEPAPHAISSITVHDNITATLSDDPPISVPENTVDEPLSFSKRPVAASAHRQQSTFKAGGGLSSLLSTASTHPKTAQRARPCPTSPALTIQPPHKINNTKHAGQQSLSVRSDGRLLVTGGWDSRVRIYSAKTLREVAVLKWHKEGVYAVAFGEVLDAENLRRSSAEEGVGETEHGEVAKRETGLSKLQRQRKSKMQLQHWVAAGAKDGKVSLWEVF
ncbi:WD40 repeat-like protein [Macroventuria anomochaeta]|uniref:WD40 repeat-like protein n=1 Tax=Macroventuria anomochaeta TaxID=301207 RepID=A0ACB6S9Q9_9PLEO|nr:WD40 repeat-like protein [Macroventuria anomochaeta]KAF2630946.1 WD40 repeat-like protein [Macroventuria anomochaeta]